MQEPYIYMVHLNILKGENAGCNKKMNIARRPIKVACCVLEGEVLKYKFSGKECGDEYDYNRGFELECSA